MTGSSVRKTERLTWTELNHSPSSGETAPEKRPPGSAFPPGLEVRVHRMGGASFGEEEAANRRVFASLSLEGPC